MIKSVVLIKGGPRAMMAEMKGDGMKAALSDALLHWHAKFLPLHFEQPAHARYHYESRTAKWADRKLRTSGSTRDLVWTGRLMQEARAQIKISGTAVAMRGALSVPSYMYKYEMRGPRRLGPDKAAEVLRTIKSEEKEMGEVAAEVLAKRLDKLNTTETFSTAA